MSGTTLTLAWLGTVMLAWFIRRNPAYPAFVAVSLGVATLSTAGLFLNHAQPWWVFAAVGQAVAIVHFLRLAQPRLRPLWYRATISVPGLTFVAGSFLALPWAAASTLGLPAYGWQLPYALGIVGAVQSFRNPGWSGGGYRRRLANARS